MKAHEVFEKVDLTRKMKFKGIEPLAERLTKETSIVVIGEFHGGTRAFSMHNLLGTVKVLEGMAQKGAPPDLLVINGGILPSVPIHISRRNQDRMRFLAPGVNTIEDAAVVVRPHLKRLLAPLNGSSRVAYVLGEEDVENMKSLKDAKIAQMKNAKATAQKIESLELARESLKSRLAAITHSQKVVEGRISTMAQEFSDGKVADKKESAKRERDYQACARTAKKLSKESDKVRRKMAAKERQLAILRDEAGQMGAVKRTKTERITPEENRLLDEEVRKEYYDLLHDIFEGANRLEILDSRLSVFNVNGMALGLGHNLSAASSSAKKTELALKEYMQNKNELYRLMPPLDMLLFSHHPGTKCWSGPKEFGKDGVSVIFQQGSFADPKLISDAWNKGIRLPQTDSVDRYHFDSGITVMTANADGSFSFDLIGHQELKKGAQEVYNRENEHLKRRLRGGVDAFLRKAGKGAKGDDESQKELERCYILSKLPSELTPIQLAERIRLEVENGADKRTIIDALAPSRPLHACKAVKVEVFSDTHIGAGNPLDDFSNYELLEACIRDSNERGLPDILVLGGDMVEGALGSKLNEYVARNYIDQKEFMKRVDARSGLSAEEKMKARMEYLQRQNFTHPVTQVEQQVNLLHPLLRHAVDIVNRGGDVILVSGNHYNQSQKNENFDEATHLAKDIRLLGGFEDNNPHIHIFSGGWLGSGEVTVQGIPVFGIHKGKGSRDKITGLMDHRIEQKRPGFLYVEGHYHTPVFGKDLAGIFLSAPSIAPAIPFVDQAALKAGTRGYTRIDLAVDDIGRHRFRAKITNVFGEQLKKQLADIDQNYLSILREMFRQSK
ncbi:hypothetical protein L0Y65_05100 [Candidatus Micrarchaeota archaeon]|nr:hypothetical protein [Candidatus Micrarchaeota archaeon]